MKIAVINFSGNVGKTTVARHLLMPRIETASLISVESLHADAGEGQALRGRQFGELQEYLQTVENVVVDIGASNVEELLTLMNRYRGSHEDFDYFVVPTVASHKQQQDTIATLVEMESPGFPASRLRLLFNMAEANAEVSEAFNIVLAFLAQHPVVQVNTSCQLGANEIDERIKGSDVDPQTLAHDKTDFKICIAQANGTAKKLGWAQMLATRRLARGVVPELDACFGALQLTTSDALPDLRR
jgi:hypothetical protein